MFIIVSGSIICSCFYLCFVEKDLRGKSGVLGKVLKTKSNLRIFYLLIGLVTSAYLARIYFGNWWSLPLVIAGAFLGVFLPEFSGSRKNLEKYGKNTKRNTNINEKL